MNTIYGFKADQTQKYTSSGKRIPVTVVKIEPNIVTQIKDKDKDGYKAVQVMLGGKKRVSRPIFGQVKKALGEKAGAPKYLREIRVTDLPGGVEVGSQVKATEALAAGDLVNVTAVSRGKGFAGVVKRHHFAGGPKTHGQSDRLRAPGSIGQTTTPGRVYKGKRMAGHMGANQATIRNLAVMDVSDTQVVLKGTIPGPKGVLAKLTKVGEDKHFQPLMSGEEVDKAVVAQEQAIEAQAETVQEKTQAESVSENETSPSKE